MLGTRHPAAILALCSLALTAASQQALAKKTTVDSPERLVCQLHGPAAKEASAALTNMGARARGALEAYLLQTVRKTDRQPGMERACRDVGSIALARGRGRAAALLGRLGAPAVPVLMKVLTGGAPDIGNAVAVALGRLGQPALPGLIKALSHRSVLVRHGAARALMEMGPSAAVAIPALIVSLAHKDENLRQRIESAIQKIGKPGQAAIPGLVKAMRHRSAAVRGRAVDALGQLGPAAVAATPALIRALNDRVFDVKYGAICTLGSIGPAARASVPALIRRLGDRNSDIVDAAIESLSSISAAAVPPLKKAFRRGKGAARTAAARALGRIGGSGLTFLITALKSRNTGVKRAASRGLAEQRRAFPHGGGRKGDVAAQIAAYEGIISHKDEEVRWGAVVALSKLRHERALALLTRAAVDPSLRVGAAAARAVLAAKIRLAPGQAGKVVAAALRDKNRNVRAAAAGSLARSTTLAGVMVRPLSALVRTDADPHVRRAAVEALRGVRKEPRRVAATLLAALSDSDAGVQAAAARLVGQRCSRNKKDTALGRTAAARLVSALFTRHRDVNIAAACALAEIGPPAADQTSALIKALGDSEPRVRRCAARALGNVGQTAGSRGAAPRLIRALKDRDGKVRKEAARALGSMTASAAVISALIRALADRTGPVTGAAFSSLVGFGQEAEPALKKAAGGRNLRIKKAAKRALIRIMFRRSHHNQMNRR